MKHTLIVTILLVAMFLGSQIIGLFITKHYLPEQKGEPPKELPFDIERPQIEEKTSYLPIFISILLATLIAFALIKFKAYKLWKLWFFLAISFTLIIALSSFIPQIIALIISVVVALLLIFKPNVIIQNLVQLFIYGGLAAIFVPILNIISISILLVLISIYDVIAVWKTKHMVSLAKFQTKSKLFAGLSIPYEPKTSKIGKIGNKKYKLEKGSIAILGGGDIGFPLLFSGVILKTYNMQYALITTLFITLSLFALFLISKKGKFYPGMPFLSAGCFLGYLFILLIK